MDLSAIRELVLEAKLAAEALEQAATHAMIQTHLAKEVFRWCLILSGACGSNG